MPQDYENDIAIDLVIPRLCAKSIDDLWDRSSVAISENINIPKSDIAKKLHEASESHSSYQSDGVAAFHIKNHSIEGNFATLLTLHNPLDLQAADGIDVKTIYVLSTSFHESGTALRRISRVTRILKSENVKDRIAAETSADAIKGILSQSKNWTLAA